MTMWLLKTHLPPKIGGDSKRVIKLEPPGGNKKKIGSVRMLGKGRQGMRTRLCK